jgi:hypothetical protein
MFRLQNRNGRENAISKGSEFRTLIILAFAERNRCQLTYCLKQKENRT